MAGGWLQNEGRLISTVDLLLATAAILDAAPIVTRNPKHFDRIPDLEVIGSATSGEGVCPDHVSGE